jgi:hypothetical protein
MISCSSRTTTPRVRGFQALGGNATSSGMSEASQAFTPHWFTPRHRCSSSRGTCRSCRPACSRRFAMQGGMPTPPFRESDSRRGLEPLCAYYTPVCVSAIERRIAAGDRRVIAFYDDVNVARLTADRVAQFGDPSLLFMNVNTPEERVLAEAHGASTDGGRDRQEA